MLKFRQTLEQKIGETIPELKNKVQIGAVDAEISAPFATYSIKDEPLRSKSGIVSLNTQVDINIYHSNSKAIEDIKRSIISALDSQIIESKKLLYVSGEYGFYEDVKISLNAYTLTFKVK